MTRVRVQGGIERGFYVLTARGHADFEPGNDIVCASISALVYALAGTLQNLPHEELTHREEPGDVMVYCKSGDRAVYGAFLCAEVGLRQIAAAYPENLSVE